MLIKYCLSCPFHQIREGDQEEYSLCTRENCYSQFSKCLSKHALARFLEQEKLEKEERRMARA